MEVLKKFIHINVHGLQEFSLEYEYKSLLPTKLLLEDSVGYINIVEVKEGLR